MDVERLFVFLSLGLILVWLPGLYYAFARFRHHPAISRGAICAFCFLLMSALFLKMQMVVLVAACVALSQLVLLRLSFLGRDRSSQTTARQAALWREQIQKEFKRPQTDQFEAADGADASDSRPANPR